MNQTLTTQTTNKNKQQLLGEKVCIKFKENISEENFNRLEYLFNVVSVEQLHLIFAGIQNVTKFIQQQYNIESQDFIRFYANIKEWKITKFITPWLIKENTPLFQQIAHITFQNLQTLSLPRLAINNIQPISYINCPNLKNLSIVSSQNFSLKPLIKTKFNNLQSLYLFQRTINNSQYRSLTRIKTCKIMDRFQLTFKQPYQLLDYDMYAYKKVRMQNLIQAEYVDRLYV